MAEIPSTTRAYTLKLDGAADSRWRESLWSTHLTVNRGVQAWGDWLLTLRGGLPASLANDHPERQVVLALSWLSVESPAEFAPTDFIIATGQQSADERAAAMRERFARVLQQKGIPAAEHEQWMTNCAPALTASIRPDAVWVDRSAGFEALSKRHAIPEDFETVWDLIGRFFSSVDGYFQFPKLDGAPVRAGDEPEMVEQALGWLSNRFGDDEAGADFSGLSVGYERIAAALKTIVPTSGDALIVGLGSKLGVASKLDAILKTVSATGHKSATRNQLKELAVRNAISTDDITRLAEAAIEDAIKTQGNIGRKGHRDWADRILKDVEGRSGMSYQGIAKSPNRSEYSVMLDHAARRVRLAHSWIKRAEVERRAFGAAREAIASVPEVARRWLDEFCEDRTQSSAAADEYLIRRRAIDGWTELVQRWAQCAGDRPEDYQRRIDIAREMQADPEIEKFGDIQLFEAIAANDARSVWLTNGRPNADILKIYVNARLAEHDQRRFKVPAYRHPDALRHPVFVDFGNSRWNIEYTALVAAQERTKLREQLAKADTDIKKRKVTQKLAASPDLHRVTLGLWTGEGVEDVPLKWHSKRLRNDLDFNHFDEAGPTVARGDRLGRAQAGSANAAITIAEVFQQKDWNGRLQAPRAEMNQLADYLARRGLPIDDMRQWDAGAKKLWGRLGWLLSFSAKLKPHGPWLDYVEQGLPEGVAYKKGRDEFFLTHEANKPRKGKTQLRLQRLPGLRIVSVDLGHR